MPNIIEFQSICKNFKISLKNKGVWGSFLGLFKRKYKTVEALQNVSFSIEEGDIVGYIGPNGAGKITFFYIIYSNLFPVKSL